MYKKDNKATSFKFKELYVLFNVESSQDSYINFTASKTICNNLTIFCRHILD